jgi:hypothetical protein
MAEDRRRGGISLVWSTLSFPVRTELFALLIGLHHYSRPRKFLRIPSLIFTLPRKSEINRSANSMKHYKTNHLILKESKVGLAYRDINTEFIFEGLLYCPSIEP